MSRADAEVGRSRRGRLAIALLAVVAVLAIGALLAARDHGNDQAATTTTTAAEPGALPGTSWQIREARSSSAAVGFTPDGIGAHVVLTFDDSDAGTIKMVGFDGCTDIATPIKIDGDLVTPDDLGASTKTCTAGSPAPLVRAVLAAPFTYAIEDDRMTLTSTDDPAAQLVYLLNT